MTGGWQNISLWNTSTRAGEIGRGVTDRRKGRGGCGLEWVAGKFGVTPSKENSHWNHPELPEQDHRMQVSVCQSRWPLTAQVGH